MNSQFKASYAKDDFSKKVMSKIIDYPNYEIIDDCLYRKDLLHGRRLYVPEKATVERFGAK